MKREGSETVLELDGIHKRFGDRPVLRGIDLTVKAGEVVVLIGASGSGKTSLLRCINLLNIPDQGRITIAGEPIFDVEENGRDRLKLPQRQVNRIRAKTGMVFQQFNLFPHMTALGNVIEGPVIVQGIARETAEKRGCELLDQMGLADHRRHILGEVL